MSTVRRVPVVVGLLFWLAACNGQPSAPAPPAPQTFTVRGLVRDELFARTYDPVPGATVALAYAGDPGPARSVATGADGAFQIAGVAEKRELRITVTKGGYLPSVRDLPGLTADGAVDIGLAPIRVTVSGTISDAIDNSPVAGALVEITSGSNRGKTAQTDAAGRFELPFVWGDFSASVSRINYETRVISVEAAIQPHIAVTLAPVAPLARTTMTGDLCTVVTIPPYLSCTAPKERRHTIDVQRSGAMIVYTEYRYVGDYYPNSLSLELRCGSELVRPVWVVPPVSAPITVALPRACLYELRLFDFIADTKGGAQTTYRVVADYPR